MPHLTMAHSCIVGWSWPKLSVLVLIAAATWPCAGCASDGAASRERAGSAAVSNGDRALENRGSNKPNIIVIVADDLGYGDLGFTGSKDIPTPRIDSLASQSVRCSQGYVSAPQCAPMRAGLLTGRYQNRFGFEHNGERQPGYEGLPLSERTVADRLKDEGYATALIGKWHLGIQDPRYRPMSRGFTHHYGFLGGANHYFADKRPTQLLQAKIFRNGQEVDEKEYLTDAFAREAVDYIDSHKADPFFLYLAFNAPHTPNQVTDEYLQRVKHIADPERRKYAAMICSLDDAVGRVIDKIQAEGLDEHTLIFFVGDNGGQLKHGFPSNAPFRGGKGDTLEGGIHVPFLVCWTGSLPAGKIYDQPVITLDILPTALAASGTPQPGNLDGVNLLPYLSGKKRGAPHEELFWRFNFPPGAEADRHTWAIRRGDWKLVKNRGEEPRLYNLATDPGERTDLSRTEPRKAQAMRKAWEQWNSQMIDPIWGDSAPAPKRKKRKADAAA